MKVGPILNHAKKHAWISSIMGTTIHDVTCYDKGCFEWVGVTCSGRALCLQSRLPIPY